MIVVVSGGRDYANRNRVRETLDYLLEHYKDLVIVHGGCNCKEHEPNIGADFFANEWAKDRDVECVPFFADWKEFGRAGGPVRNKRMIESVDGIGMEAMMVAFPGGNGTKNAIAIAKKHGLEVTEIKDAVL